MTRTMESEVSVMCNLSKGVMEKNWEKGMEKGLEQGLLSSIKSLMEAMGWAIDQAMAALKVPKKEHQGYHNLLNKQS